MPTVDPTTHQPESDDPDNPQIPPAERGGKRPGDPGLAGAAENGGEARGNVPDDLNISTRLPGERRSK